MIPSDDKDRAQRELRMIDELTKFEPFSKYYLPRLKEKQAALAVKILEDDSLSMEERERLRRTWKEYNEILRMPDSDAMIARGKINPQPGRG